MAKIDGLVLEVLRCLSQEKILDHVLIIGSWGAYFYQDYFKHTEYHPTLKSFPIQQITVSTN